MTPFDCLLTQGYDVCTPEFKQFWNEKNIADECLHPFWTVSNAKGAKCALALPFLSKSNYAWFVHIGYTD